MVRVSIGVICLSLFLAACGGIDGPLSSSELVQAEEDAVVSTASALTEGSADAVGILDFLDAQSTTFRVLDIDARLHRRTARAIVHYRNGPDGVHGTTDDNRITSVQELDDIRFVGGRSIAAILVYCEIHGLIPVGDDLLGRYDGVSFNVDQGDAVIAVVNSAGERELDVLAKLDIRAVRSILRARPITSVEQLSKLYYVGGTALEHLLEYTERLVRAASTPSLP
jgi:hypothetical protein